jgi:hypothetical protein
MRSISKRTGVLTMALSATATVVIVAVVGDRGARPPRVPSTPEEIVRAYVRAYDQRDAAAACRLSVAAAESQERCRERLRGDFAWYAEHKRAWRHVALASLRLSA